MQCAIFPYPQWHRNPQQYQDLHRYFFFFLLILPQLHGVEKSAILLICLIASALIGSAFLICLWYVLASSCWLLTGF